MKTKMIINQVSTNLLIILTLTFTSLSLAQENATGGELTFSEETIDYGDIAQNSNGQRTFKFTNTGDSPVVISNVKASCGCTVPEYPTTPILPGAEGKILVKYDTKRIGAFSKSLTVVSNSKEGQKILKIKGSVAAEQ